MSSNIRVWFDMDKIYSLEIGKKYRFIANVLEFRCDVLRVPGGWIFEQSNDDGSCFSCVFVPFIPKHKALEESHGPRKV